MPKRNKMSEGDNIPEGDKMPKRVRFSKTNTQRMIPKDIEKENKKMNKNIQ